MHHGKDIFVGMRDVPIRYSKEEFVPDTEHRGQNILVAMRDVPIMYRKEEYVGNMGHHGQNLLAARNQEEMCRHEGCTTNIET